MQVSTYNVPHAYFELLNLIRLGGVQEASRNGPVIVLPEPVMLQIYNPNQRVLFSPTRRANPFFHVMETVWMLAGENDVRFLLEFNKRYREYAEYNGKVHGAYGFRWRNHFGTDQLISAVCELQNDTRTRQVVLGMWDPLVDLGAKVRDRPCNTHIYFRPFPDNTLDMMVCNRSNDLIWGMMGANAVHMTYLHELIALASGYRLGRYWVATNNLHYYPDLYPNAKEIWSETGPYDYYHEVDFERVRPTPILQTGDSFGALLIECQRLVGQPFNLKGYNTTFMTGLVLPMIQAWRTIKAGGTPNLDAIIPTDWRKACSIWVQSRA